MVLAEVDQRPADHPAAHGEEGESSCDQNHVAEDRPTGALGHLRTGERKKYSENEIKVFTRSRLNGITSETIVQTSLRASMTVMKIAKW